MGPHISVIEVGMTNKQLDKITSSRRLIEAAIEATVEGKEPLMICVTAYAAYNTLKEYVYKNGTIQGSKVFARVVKSKELRKALSRYPNFLKHARDGHMDVHEELGPEFNDILILFSVMLYTDITGAPTKPMEHFKLLSIFCLIKEDAEKVEKTGWDVLLALVKRAGMADREKLLAAWRTGKIEPVKVEVRPNEIKGLGELLETVGEGAAFAELVKALAESKR